MRGDDVDGGGGGGDDYDDDDEILKITSCGPPRCVMPVASQCLGLHVLLSTLFSDAVSLSFMARF